jgi:hypothetical protein
LQIIGHRQRQPANQRAVFGIAIGAGSTSEVNHPMHKIRTAIVASTILISPAFAHDHERGDNDDHGHHFHGAPGPIAGAGLPVLAVGFGVYWLVRRRRRKAE